MSSASIPIPDQASPTATVLIVEDEALIRAAIADMLQDRGFKVLEAANANEAIEIIEEANIEIDLVFTDVRMPGGMDGFGLVKWIQDSRPTVPVIVASGDIGRANDENRVQLGDRFISKPYDLDRTEAKIREAITLRKSGPSRTPEVVQCETNA
jgi:DNA-binding NtrC family response regulator